MVTNGLPEKARADLLSCLASVSFLITLITRCSAYPALPLSGLPFLLLLYLSQSGTLESIDSNVYKREHSRHARLCLFAALIDVCALEPDTLHFPLVSCNCTDFMGSSRWKFHVLIFIDTLSDTLPHGIKIDPEYRRRRPVLRPRHEPSVASL